MADDEYNKKLDSLQQYIPFLDSMIIQLKDPSKKNREQQLSKMESLHTMITDKKKKLKLETLIRCEDVISKLYQKVHSKSVSTIKKISPSSPSFTPASPSPPRDLISPRPLTIPTERLDDLRIPKIDVYSRAAESLNRARRPSLTIDGRLPDMSKPPISLEDLKTLEDDVQDKINESCLNKASLNELNSLRDKLTQQIHIEDEEVEEGELVKSPKNKHKPESINTTVRNNGSLTKPPDKPKVKEKIESPTKDKSPKDKSSVETSPKKEHKNPSPPKPKILKEPPSIFGNILSKLDEQIIVGKKKKEDRRNSTGKDDKKNHDPIKPKSNDKSSDSKKKDRPSSSKDEKKHDKKVSKIEDKPKGENLKDPYNLSGKKTFEKEEEKIKNQLQVKDKDEEIVPKSNTAVNIQEKNTKILPSDKTDPKSSIQPESNKPVYGTIGVKKEQELKSNSVIVIDDVSPIKSPAYKRLADKYNPKPKKTSSEPDVDKLVSDSIEEKMKMAPPSLPKIKQIPLPTPPPPSLVLCSQAEPECPIPTPVPAPVPAPLPAVLQNILNPQTTQLINKVVSSLRAENEGKQMRQQMPLLPSPSPNLMSPRDSFVSEYVREQQGNFNEYSREDEFTPNNVKISDFNNIHSMQPQMRNERLNFEPPSNNYVPPSPRYVPPPEVPINRIPPLLGERFNENFPTNRPFTPQLMPERFPQQFNNFHLDAIQPLDYYPPNAPVPSNPYNCGPPLLSPEVPHMFNEQKPANFGMMPNQDMFGRGEWRQDDRQFWDRRDQDMRMNRDPRTYREYREMRDSRDTRSVNQIRDPRLNRDLRDRDPPADREPPRDRDRDPRDRDYRDPRLNRDSDRDRRPRDSRPQSRDTRQSRYDSKFDRMYSRTNRDRSRSRSRSRSSKDTFTSPLDSLYSGKEEHKTGKGYGVQHFRIPKIKKEEDEEKQEPVKTTVTIEEPNEDEIANDDNIDNDDNDDVECDEPEVTNEDKTEDEVAASEKEKEVEVPKEIVQDVETEKPSEPPRLEKESEGTKADATKNVEGAKEPILVRQLEPEAAKPTEQTILAQFFANLLGSQNKKEKKTALYSLISTFSDSFSHKELSKITKIIKADDEDEEESSEDEEETKKPDQKPEVEKPQEPVKEAPTEITEHENESVKPKKKARKRIRRISSGSPVKEVKVKEPEVPHIPEPEVEDQTLSEPVVVSVGERIKSRKRASVTPPKPKKKFRTELDMLHEDIQDMFIRDGVLTASGKRMCRLLKNDPNALIGTATNTPVQEEPPKRRKPGPKPKLKAPNAADVSAMKAVRVVISKIPDSDLEQKEESTRRNLRRSTRNTSYAESDDDDNDSSVREETSTLDAESLADSVRGDTDEETSDKEEKSSQTSEGSQKTRIVKRKRGKGWASGIIPNKKKKKKQQADEIEEAKKVEDFNESMNDSELDKSYVEPDKNYYIDGPSSKTHQCKICDFQGRFITTHYKTNHPESEVMSSRFSPTIAEAAITDSEKNLSTYESVMRMKGSGKFNYTCRFCEFSCNVVPTLFYDHITTHTGEYRHKCPSCEFSAPGGKTLKSHMTVVHDSAKRRVARKSFGNTIIFGYMCGECNYVQLTEKNVEEHINIFHLEKPVMYKINMSTYMDPEIEKIALSEMSNMEPTPTEDVEEISQETLKVPEKISKKEKSKRQVKKAEKVEIEEKPQQKVDADKIAETEKADMPPPQRKKPGPKCSKRGPKKKSEATKTEMYTISDSSSDTESIKSLEKEEIKVPESPVESKVSKPTTKRRLTREVSAEDDTIIPGRSKRAAKEKATEKLKTLMETTENLYRKKSLPTSDELTKAVEKKKEEGPKAVEDTSKSAKDSENTISDKISSNSEALDDATAKEKTPVPEENKPEKIKVKKEIEMNVFTCKTDLQEENKKIEQERLQLMEELNKSVGSRTSLHFTDKLCDRLNQKDVLIKQEPQDDLTDSLFGRQASASPLVMPVLEKNSPTATPSTSAKITQNEAPPVKKPVFVPEYMHVSPQNFEVAHKNDKVITDMIQKLKGKLANVDVNINDPVGCLLNMEDDYDSEGPPPLTHVNELVKNKTSDSTPGEVLLIGGLIKVIKISNSLTFSCLVPPCVFSTKDKAAFETHCKESHKNSKINIRPTTLCETCGIEIIFTPECTLLENLFRHTVTDHSDFIEGKVAAETNVKPPIRVLRLRKLSGDALSVKKDWDERDDPLQNTAEETDKGKENKENHSTVNNTSVSELQCLEEIETASEEELANMAEIELSMDDNPFPFKISGVMSLAEPHPPPLMPIAKPLAQGSQLIVKEAKLTLAELKKPKKTQKAMSKFITSVSELYKCPHYYCLFTTNFRDFFERHLKAHKVEHDVMIPCVYCDLKTPWEHVPMHIDVRHSHCRYACSYCLYRAVVKEYVFLHQDQEHPKSDYSVIALPPIKSTKKFAIADVKLDPKVLCEPFKCTSICNVEYLFENEFKRHLKDAHHNAHFIICGYKDCTSRAASNMMIKHWAMVHGISTYQCGYCKVSCRELKQMYYHLAQVHQSQQQEIYIRMHPSLQDVDVGYTPEAFNILPKALAASPNTILSETKIDRSPKESGFVVASSGNTCKLTQITKPASPIMLTALPKVTSKSLLIPTTNTQCSKSVLSGGTFTILSSTPGTSGTTSNILFLPTVSGANISGIVVKPQSTLVNSVASSNVSVREVPSIPPQPIPFIQDISTVVEPEKIVENEHTTAPVEHITVGEETNQLEESDNADVDPLNIETDLSESVKSLADAFSSDDESDSNKADKSKKTKCGLLSYQLYRCAFCEISFSNSNDFRKHVTKSLLCKNDDLTGKPYVCVHCDKKVKNGHALVEHIQSHGMLRFSCSLCTSKFSSTNQARSHAKSRHNICQTTLTPVNPGKNNLESDEYVVRPKLGLQPLPPTSKDFTSGELNAESSACANEYTPDQIDKIPMRHILSSSVKCAICSYSTKVRTNMVRHLQFHSEEKAVPDTAPVNPVPCLEKNEKMFDKMINLASSSHANSRMGGPNKTEGKEKEAENLPDFVPTHCRYACCAEGCSYICPEEGNLRHHLIALHDGETAFKCVHCKHDLTPTDADNLIKHYKLHGLQLHKCQYCSFVHYLRHKVEKHTSDSHLDLPVKVITVRALEAAPKDTTHESSTSEGQIVAVPSTSKINKPWRCCMCKYRHNSQEGVQNHVLEKHEFDSQFKCALCTYKSNDEETFTGHFKEMHDNQIVDIIYTYRKLEEGKEKETEATFDTTPLWQRDRPRVRHIRGILFDDVSPVPAKSPKKPKAASAVTTPAPSPVPSTSKGIVAVSPVPGTSKSSLDQSIEAVANGTADILKNSAALSDDFNVPEETVQPKDNDVIIIDDEDEGAVPLAKNKDNKNAPMAKNRGVKRKIVDGDQPAKISEEEIIDLDSSTGSESESEEFSERSLKLTFGAFGTPQNKQLKCPICNQFKSKRISDFIFHLFKEMKVYRFKCRVCSDESITYRYMYKHVQEHNCKDSYSKNILALPANRRLEAWTQMVIREQSLIILQNFTPVPDSGTVDDDDGVQCQHCHRKFSNEQEKNEHSIVHWSLRPYGCGKCKFNTYNKKDIIKHFGNAHPVVKETATLNIVVKAPTVSRELSLADELHMKEVGDANESLTSSAEPGVEDGAFPADEGSKDRDPLEDVEELPKETTEVEGAKENEAYLSDNDLVIVTKTDVNVPTEGDIFCCEHCPFMASSEVLVLFHLSNAHENMVVKFKKLNKMICEQKFNDFVACNICSEVGSEITVRQHFLETHATQTFVMYRFTCNYCDKRFLKIGGMKTHFNKQHHGMDLKYTSILQNMKRQVASKPVAGKKPASMKCYKCPLCFYERNFPPNGVGNVRNHVRQHFKSFFCGSCNNRYKTRWEAMVHFHKEHPGQRECINQNSDVITEFNNAIAIVLRDAKPVNVDEVAEVETKNTARKSTSAPFRRIAEYSYYGTQPEPVDLTKISTSVEINGMCLGMTAEKLSKIFDLEPQLVLEDCNLSVNLSSIFDS